MEMKFLRNSAENGGGVRACRSTTIRVSRPFQGNVTPCGGGGGNKFRCAARRWKNYEWNVSQISVARRQRSPPVLQNWRRYHKKLKKKEKERGVSRLVEGKVYRHQICARCKLLQGDPVLTHCSLLCEFFAECGSVVLRSCFFHAIHRISIANPLWVTRIPRD